MKTICPHCNQKYDIPDEYLNRELCCEKCGRNFIGKKAKFCPDCGVVNHAEALNCRSCDFQFVQSSTKIKQEQALEALPLKSGVTIIPHTITAICPHCTQSYTFPDGYINKEMVCQCCHNNFVIVQAISCPRCKSDNHPLDSYCQKCLMDLQSTDTGKTENKDSECDFRKIRKEVSQLITISGKTGIVMSYIILIPTPLILKFAIISAPYSNTNFAVAGIGLALIWIFSSVGRHFNKLILASIDSVLKWNIGNIVCCILFFIFRLLFVPIAFASWWDSRESSLENVVVLIICLITAWYRFSTYSYFVAFKWNKMRSKNQNINVLGRCIIKSLAYSCISVICVVALMLFFRNFRWT